VNNDVYRSASINPLKPGFYLNYTYKNQIVLEKEHSPFPLQRPISWGWL